MDTFIIRLLDLQEKLFRIALCLTRDRERAKDLLQDTYLRTLENRDKYRTDENLPGWVSRIMSNIFISDCRQIARTQEHICVSTDLELSNIHDYDFIADHNSLELTNAIEKLSPKKQTVIKLFLAGFKYEEIAERENIPIGTVKSQIHQAKEELKKLMK